MGQACKVTKISTKEFIRRWDAMSYQKLMCVVRPKTRHRMKYKAAEDARTIRIQPAANRGAVKAGAGWGCTVEPHATANTRPASAIRREPGVTYCPTANLGSQYATMNPNEAAQMRQYYEDQSNGFKREYKKRWVGKVRCGKARTSKHKEI